MLGVDVFIFEYECIRLCVCVCMYVCVCLGTCVCVWREEQYTLTAQVAQFEKYVSLNEISHLGDYKLEYNTTRSYLNCF